jgi:hypothetical protein
MRTGLYGCWRLQLYRLRKALLHPDSTADLVKYFTSAGGWSAWGIFLNFNEFVFRQQRRSLLCVAHWYFPVFVHINLRQQYFNWSSYFQIIFSSLLYAEFMSFNSEIALCAAYCTCTLCTMYTYSTLCTMYGTLCTVYCTCILCTMYRKLCTVYSTCTLCTMHAYSTLCTMYTYILLVLNDLKQKTIS